MKKRKSTAKAKSKTSRKKKTTHLSNKARSRKKSSRKKVAQKQSIRGRISAKKGQKFRKRVKRSEIPEPTAPIPKLIPVEEQIGELPFSYNKTQLVLMVRDPYWAYGYWDFSSETWNWIQNFFKVERNARSILRVHNLNQGIYYDLQVELEAKSWYLQLLLPDTAFEAELGLLDSSGHFHLIAKSSQIRTPRNVPSDVIDPSWTSGAFEEIYQLSGGGKTGHGSEIFSQVKKRS